MTDRYVVAPCREYFVVVDTAAQVMVPGCRLAADGPFDSVERAELAIDALLSRDAIEART